MQLFPTLLFLSCIFFAHISSAKVIIFVGPPGSGKGTQTTLLRDALGIPLIAPSNILREARMKKNFLALLAKTHSDSQELTDAVKTNTVVDAIAKAAPDALDTGLIIDSWPKRGSALTKAWQVLFRKDPPLVIELNVEKDILVKRAVMRRVCTNAACGKTFGCGAKANADDTCTGCGTKLFQRAGDTGSHFPHRIEKYFGLRDEIYESYGKYGVLVHKIDGDRPPKVVHNEVLKLVKEYLK